MRSEGEEEDGQRDVIWVLLERTGKRQGSRKRRRWTGSDGEAGLTVATPNGISRGMKEL